MKKYSKSKNKLYKMKGCSKKRKTIRRKTRCGLKGGCNCGIPFFNGGGHRNGCKCSECKNILNGGGATNLIPLNNYKTDITRQMQMTGGSLSNTISQDFVNLGRQLQYGLGSTFNALSGQSGSVNPLPWKGHFGEK